MTTIYVDPSGTILARPSAGKGAVADSPRVLPGAIDALRTLREEHYEVIVIAAEPIEQLEDLGDALRFDPRGPDEVPIERDRPRRNGKTPRSWLISADEGWSERARPAGLRTVRIGPRTPDSHRPTARFDLEARDLQSAVLEILVQDILEP